MGDIKLEKDYENYKGYIYISLYGLNDLKELEYEIISSIFKKYVDIDKPYNLRRFTKIVSRFSEKFKSFEENLLSVIGEFQNYSEYIFILDDLERTTISFNNILGFINKLSDNIGCKVIVIGNQSEIDITRLSDNIELKQISNYLSEISSNVSLQKSNEKISKEASSIKNTKLTKWINNNDEYRMIKEKTFGHTFKFSPNFENIYEKFREEYFLDENFINVEEIKELLLKYDIINLRTIKKSMNTYNFISKYLNEKETTYISNNELKILVFEYILYYTHQSTVFNSATTVGDSSTSFVNKLRNKQKYFDYFNFIKNLVDEGSIQNFEENIQLFLNHLTKMNSDSKMKDIIYKLQHFISYTDDDVEELIKEFGDMISSNRFDPRYFESFIEIIRTLIYFEYSIPIQYVDVIKENAINNVESYQDFYRNSRVGYDSELTNKIDKEVEEFFIRFEKEKTKFIIDYENDWLVSYIDYCRENRNLIISKGVLSFIDIYNLKDWLLSTTPNEIEKFRNLIITYPLAFNINKRDEEKYCDDLSLMKEISEQIKRTDKTGSIQIKYLISNLDSLLEKYG